MNFINKIGRKKKRFQVTNMATEGFGDAPLKKSKQKEGVPWLRAAWLCVNAGQDLS